ALSSAPRHHDRLRPSARISDRSGRLAASAPAVEARPDRAGEPQPRGAASIARSHSRAGQRCGVSLRCAPRALRQREGSLCLWHRARRRAGLSRRRAVPDRWRPRAADRPRDRSARPARSGHASAGNRRRRDSCRRRVAHVARRRRLYAAARSGPPHLVFPRRRRHRARRRHRPDGARADRGRRHAQSGRLAERRADRGHLPQRAPAICHHLVPDGGRSAGGLHRLSCVGGQTDIRKKTVSGAPHYISTRGLAPRAGFEDVLLAGLAPDGGLYLPETWPRFTAAEIAGLRRRAAADYDGVATDILARFTGDAFTRGELLADVAAAYGGFDDPLIVPIRAIAPGLYILELFHGPTLAFKDLALQVLGRLFARSLA